MSLWSKLKPYQVDLLLFGIEKGSTPSVSKLKPLQFPLTFEPENSWYVIRDGEILVHKSKVFHSSRLLRAFGFAQPLMTIGDCLTDEAFKGQGIYPAVLASIVAEHGKTKSIYMLVSPTNIPSIKGIEKAGFELIARLKCLKIGPFYFNKTKESL